MDTSVTENSTALTLSSYSENTDFDWTVYTQLYDDLSSLPNHEDAWLHWVEYGQNEGRMASLSAMLRKYGVAKDAFPLDFDWEGYLALNPDLQGHLPNKWKSILHYVQFGIKEGRPYRTGTAYRAPSLSEAFDWKFYLWHNRDLEWISTEEEAERHWLEKGKRSGRIATPAAFYREQNADISQLPRDFDAEEYLSLHPVLEKNGVTQQWHIISHFLSQDESTRQMYSFKGLGLSLQAKSENAKAIEAFEKAAKYHPDDREIDIYLSKVLAENNCWQRALAVHRKVAQSGTVSGWTLFELGRDLLQIIEKQLAVTVERSKEQSLQHLTSIKNYQEMKTPSVKGERWQSLTETLSSLVEQNLWIERELTHLKQMHQAVASTFHPADFITFPQVESPVVSIIIPVYNKVSYTIRCLRSLVHNVSDKFSYEVIVVNDCSSDETKEYLEAIEALVLVNNVENIGFIHSCNAGANASKGKYLYFLNNDTEVMPNAIESLVETFATTPNVGAVGSKLLYPTGRLQEAGGIIWQNSSGWNYGRNENPHDPKYNFMRSVDYCSGASLLVKRETFDALNGFERDFAPAYYEDTDLCFAVRHKLGLEVIYQPKSEIIHYEGISSGTSTSSGIKRYQVINAEKFKKKWADALRRHPINEKGYEDAHRAARRFQGSKTVLVVDSYLPYYDKEAGSRRLFQILKIFKELGCHVIFLPDDMRSTEPYISELQNMQIEVLYTCNGFGTSPEEQLKERLPLIDLAWVCRPNLMKRYLPILRENDQIEVIYDTIDLHYLRMKREFDLGVASESAKQDISWVDMQALELKMAMQAERTITVTHTEKDILEKQGASAIDIVPTIHFPYRGEKPSFEERSGLLFIGGYNHTPNVDAVEWLCREIMPLVWAHIPEMTVTLLGSNPSSKVMQLASDQVSVPGYVADVSPYFLNHRIFVAPLRFGAGMKGKIGQSLEFALPLVSTAIGVEGMNLVSGRDAIEANTTEAFASAVIRLYTNKQDWEHLARHSEAAISLYSPEAVREVLSKIVG